ncbi:DUF3108 domain-containing protein [Aquabacterium sp.]|uniref:DUF3108 domain-containing protein n=1 Tax=Aquabacterium sp. TaxID=1872578 RepID=UPI00378366A6
MSPGLLPLSALPRPTMARRRRAVVVGLLVLLAHAWLAGLWRLPAATAWQPGARPHAALQLTHIEAVPTSAPAAPPAVPTAATATAIAPTDPPRPERLRPTVLATAAPRASASAPAAAPAPLAAPAASEPAVPGADDSDTEFAGTGTDRPPPLYATQLPPPTRLQYQLRRGAAQGEARLQWQPEGEQRYTLEFQASLKGLWLLDQRSSGQLDGHGLAPERFTDRRRGRGRPSAIFDRDSHRIRFSGPPVEYPAWPGAQDRLGWVVQLAGIYRAARAAGHAPLPEVTLFVSGARGGAGLWTFRLQGQETVDGPLGPVEALYLKREPERLEDQRVEAWLDPARGHWPVRLRLTPLRGGQALEWWLAAEPAP